jgi:hypothetical protein
MQAVCQRDAEPVETVWSEEADGSLTCDARGLSGLQGVWDASSSRVRAKALSVILATMPMANGSEKPTAKASTPTLAAPV